MSALDVMSQMGGAQKGLVTPLVSALKYTFVIMRTNMLLKPGWSIEGLCASIEWTVVGFKFGRITSGSGGEWRCRGLIQIVTDQTRGPWC